MRVKKKKSLKKKHTGTYKNVTQNFKRRDRQTDRQRERERETEGESKRDRKRERERERERERDSDRERDRDRDRDRETDRQTERKRERRRIMLGRLTFKCKTGRGGGRGTHQLFLLNTHLRPTEHIAHELYNVYSKHFKYTGKEPLLLIAVYVTGTRVILKKVKVIKVDLKQNPKERSVIQSFKDLSKTVSMKKPWLKFLLNEETVNYLP